MFNFLASERYRLSRQPALYIFLAVCIGILLLMGGLMRFWDGDLTDFGIAIASLLTFGLYIFAAVFASSFSKDRSMILQLSAQGQSRMRILFGQYLMSLLVALLFAAVLLVTAVIIGFFLFDSPGADRVAFLKTLVREVATTLALLIPLHALAFSLQYLMNNIAMSVAVFFVLAFFLPAAFSLALGRHRVLDWFIQMSPYHQSLELYFNDTVRAGRAALTVFMNSAFWLIIAAVKFRKCEL